MRARTVLTTNSTVRYVGGPLDGEAAARTGNQWSIYRDDNGHHISAARGTNELLGHTPLYRYYIRQRDNYTGETCYIHGSTWHMWNMRQRNIRR